MKKITSILFCLSVLLNAYSQIPVPLPYTETFDSIGCLWDNNTQSENWTTNNNYAFVSSTTASGYISFESPVLNTTTVTEPAMQFDIRITGCGGCKPEFTLYGSTYGSSSIYPLTEITLDGQTCSSADHHQPQAVWRTYKFYNLPERTDVLFSLKVSFFGGCGTVSVDNFEFNTKDSLSSNLPQYPDDTTTTAVRPLSDASFEVIVNNNYLKIENVVKGKIAIYSLLGQVLFSKEIDSDIVDISFLNRGIYLLNIVDNSNNSWSGKVFKE